MNVPCPTQRPTVYGIHEVNRQSDSIRHAAAHTARAAEPGAGGGDRLSLQGWWFNGHARPTSQKTCEQRRPSTKTSTRSGFGECGSDRLALVTVNGAGGSMSRDEHMRYVA